MMIYLVRHALTDDNLVKRFSGSNSGIGINNEGKKQTEMLVSFFEHKEIRTIFTSPFRRCVETAQLLKMALGVNLKMVGGLREVDYGQWQSLTSMEARKKSPEIFKARGLNPATVAPPMGETLREMQKRVIKSLANITQRVGTNLVITHGSCIHVALMYYLNKNLSGFWNFNQKHKLVNCSVSEIAVLNNSKIKVGKIGYCPHLFLK